jgi:site-specific recombinase XerD
MPDDPVSEYLATLVARGISLATQRASRSDLVQFCRWWETRHQRLFDLAHVVDRDLRDWQHQRQQVDGAAPGTINRGLSTLRQFCTWAIEQKLIA